VYTEELPMSFRASLLFMEMMLGMQVSACAGGEDIDVLGYPEGNV
jgi:hypothetical protein